MKLWSRLSRFQLQGKRPLCSFKYHRAHAAAHPHLDDDIWMATPHTHLHKWPSYHNAMYVFKPLLEAMLRDDNERGYHRLIDPAYLTTVQYISILYFSILPGLILWKSQVKGMIYYRRHLHWKYCSLKVGAQLCVCVMVIISVYIIAMSNTRQILQSGSNRKEKKRKEMR